MIHLDEAALICDFAETYHIYDYRALSARRAALYACGLKADSRIMQLMSETKFSVEVTLLAIIADALRILVWQNTKDGKRGRNKPESILEMLTGNKKEEEQLGSFNTVEEFNAWRNAMLTGG